MKKIFVTLALFLPILFATAQTPQNKTEQPAEKHEYVLKANPEVADPAEVIEAIVAQNKGKAIFLDFWATWCGPCIKGMEALKPLKPEIKAKGVEIIYITGETSPLAKFEPMLSQIGGTHYRLTAAQWMAVGEKYGIKGIPYYMIYDKTGKQTFQKTGYPGNETIMQELGKVW